MESDIKITINRVSHIEVTLANDDKYILKSKEELCNVDSSKEVILVFSNGFIYTGHTDGKIIDCNEECLVKMVVIQPNNFPYAVGLSYENLIGWSYKSSPKPSGIFNLYKGIYVAFKNLRKYGK